MIPEAAVAQIEALPVPDVEELGEWQTVQLDGSTAQVLDLSTRRRWNVRRAQCGLGPCACDLQAWPADFAGEVPPAEVADGWMFWLDGPGWDALAVECGRDVSELPFEQLVEAVAQVHSGSEA